MWITTFFMQLLAAAGGGAVLALLALRAFGSSWMNSLFQKQLQNLKHQHDKDLEALRFGISDMLDRSNRLSAREFEVLPEAWALVFDAFVEADRLLQRLKRTPDFGTLSAKAKEYLLRESELVEWEREELDAKRPHEQTMYFSERMAARNLLRAKEAAQKADFYLRKMGLFLEADVHRRLSDFVDFVWRAVLAHELVQEAARDHVKVNFDRDDDEFRAEADGQVKELSTFIRQRFWSSQAAG